MCCRLSERRSLVERLRRAAQLLLTFMFTQVGVIVLVASYTVAGAFIFQNIGSRRDIFIVNYILHFTPALNLVIKTNAPKQNTGV